jgi:hypothetical protein
MLITRSDEGRPLGVIGCLRAGFEIVSRRPWLILLPVALDLLLWLGPRLSLDPAWASELADGYTALALSNGHLGPEAMASLEEAVALVREALQSFNLFSFVSLAPLLHVPTLTGHPMVFEYKMAVGSPLGTRQALLVSGAGALGGWIALLLPLGLLFGYVYLVGLARPVRRLRRARLDQPVGPFGGPETDPFRAKEAKARLRGYAARLGQLLLFGACALLAVAFALTGALLVGALSAGSAFGPELSVMTGIMGMGLAYYIGLQVAFVVPAIVLGGRRFLPAIRESVTILYVNSGAAIWFVLVVVLLHQVTGALWSLARPDTWAMAASVVGNACVVTGLTAAAFVFYQDRAARLKRLPRPVEQESRSGDESEEGTE